MGVVFTISTRVTRDALTGPFHAPPSPLPSGGLFHTQKTWHPTIYHRWVPLLVELYVRFAYILCPNGPGPLAYWGDLAEINSGHNFHPLVSSEYWLFAENARMSQCRGRNTNSPNHSSLPPLVRSSRCMHDAQRLPTHESVVLRYDQ